MPLSTTQVGAIAESLVASQLMLASDGRLSAFTPLADDDGTDLVIVDKQTAAQLRIQIKSWRARREDDPATVQFDVRRKTFSPHVDNFVLCVLLDPEDAAIWRAWLLPSDDVEGIASNYAEKFAIAASPRETSSDKYLPWRCQTMADVVGRLIGHVDQGAVQMG